jgi:beta-glucosidase
VGATIRRVAALLPGKPLIVTEHGVATDDDAERIEFIDGGLRAIHDEMDAGVPVRGYIHWSLLDNFEWARGYAPHFGLIGVDRETLERTVRPSGRHLGEIARTGRLAV